MNLLKRRLIVVGMKRVEKLNESGVEGELMEWKVFAEKRPKEWEMEEVERKKMVNFKGTSDLSEEKAGKESESEQKNIGVERKIYERKSGGLGIKD